MFRIGRASGRPPLFDGVPGRQSAAATSGDDQGWQQASHGLTARAVVGEQVGLVQGQQVIEVLGRQVERQVFDHGRLVAMSGSVSGSTSAAIAGRGAGVSA